MGRSDLAGAVLALMATIIYYLGFFVFKVSAVRMPPLRGTRPLAVFRHTYTSGMWLAGLLILLLGVVTQVKALTMLPLSTAQPIFAASLLFLLLYAVVVFHERLSGREWASVALFGLATVLIGVSNPGRAVLTSTVSSPLKLAALAVPAVLVSAVLLVVGDVGELGRHARPLAGVAYGVGSGICLGVSEIGLKAVANVYTSDGLTAAALTEPYSYIAVAMAALGLAQLQIALQRCRIAIVVSVLTVTAKTLLAVLGPLLFDEAWPADRLLLALRIGAFGLAVAALVLFPRHETVPEGPSPALLAVRERG